MHIYNSVLNEITTTHEECIKYNFVACLINSVNIRKSSGAATLLFQFLSYATELNENALFFPCEYGWTGISYNPGQNLLRKKFKIQ